MRTPCIFEGDNSTKSSLGALSVFGEERGAGSYTDPATINVGISELGFRNLGLTILMERLFGDSCYCEGYKT